MDAEWTIEFKEEPPTTIAVLGYFIALLGYFSGFEDILDTAKFYGQHVAVIIWRQSERVAKWNTLTP